jgi:SAM-dependent methyltransferase
MTLLTSPMLSIAIKCPVCGTECCEPPLYHYSVSEAAAHFCPSTRSAERNQRLESVIRKLWNGDECTVLRCPDCQFAFGYPFVGGDEEFYSILHEQKGYPSWRWDYDIAIREVLDLSTTGKILDIGAGAGVFLRSLNREWQRYAVEGSPLTRKPLEDAGIKVFQDLSIAAETEVGTFQVVTIFQVLEHLSDFRIVLTQCLQLLTEGGKIVITVPDGDAMIRQEKLTGCPDMPPNHIGKWTPSSLSRVLIEAGFTPSEAVHEPSSWKNLTGSLYLRVLADATNPKSLAAKVYRIPTKKIRLPFLGVLGIFAFLRLLPHVNKLKQGGAFAMTGTVSPS